MTLDIFLVDDRYLMRETVKAILKDEPEIRIVGTAQDGQEAIACIEKLQPDIVLLDIEMPKINGITVTKYISKLLPETQVIILSSHNDQSYITQALEAGASSYILKNSMVEDLKRAIYSLSRGYSYIEAKLLNQALDRIKVNNIVNSGNRPTHIRKYHKHIYIPTANIYSSQLAQASNLASAKDTPGISKASLAPIFDLTVANNIETADQLYANLSAISSSVKTSNYKQLNKKLILAIIAIASFVISIFIFR